MEERKEEPAPKRSYFSFDLWRKPASEARSPLDPSKFVTVDQLPMYSEQYPKSYTFVESPPLPMQEGISKVRQSATDQFGTLKERLKDADKALHKGAKAVYGLNRQVQDEWTTVPKAMAILMGGMAGYILGMRRSFFRRWLYSGAGLTTMAAFCYPNEAVAVCRAGMARAKAAWADFQTSPEPPQSGIEETVSTVASDAEIAPQVRKDLNYVAPTPELADVTPVSEVSKENKLE